MVQGLSVSIIRKIGSEKKNRETKVLNLFVPVEGKSVVQKSMYCKLVSVNIIILWDVCILRRKKARTHTHILSRLI